MRVSVNEDCCIAAGFCARTAGTVFGQSDEDDVVVLLTADPPAETHDAVRQAASLCPSQAITVS